MKMIFFFKQKVVIFLVGILCCLAFAACQEDMTNLSPDNGIAPLPTRASVYMQDFVPDRNAAVGTEVLLTDKRDNQVYQCIKLADGRWWMGENLKYNITGSVIFNNETANLDTYGRLYKWQEAMDAVPENWDLPTDDEWKVLEMALGMTQADADAASVWRSSGNVGTQLKANGSSSMNMPLSGYQHTNGTYYYSETYGRYWTSTENGATAWDRDLSSKAGVYRATYSKAYRYSVRCVLQVKETAQYMQTFVPNPADTVGTEVMLTDKRDGIVYRCIKMGDGRWWMGENLHGRFGVYKEGNPTETYGLLYDWESATDYVPEGWSLPTDAEWTTLGEALGGALIAGDKMKSTTGWDDDNGVSGNGTNSSGWNGLPGGLYNEGYGFKNEYGYWWSADNYNIWWLNKGLTDLGGPSKYFNYYQFSVRCILNQ